MGGGKTHKGHIRNDSAKRIWCNFLALCIGKLFIYCTLQVFVSIVKLLGCIWNWKEKGQTNRASGYVFQLCGFVSFGLEIYCYVIVAMLGYLGFDSVWKPSLGVVMSFKIAVGVTVCCTKIYILLASSIGHKKQDSHFQPSQIFWVLITAGYCLMTYQEWALTNNTFDGFPTVSKKTEAETIALVDLKIFEMCLLVLSAFSFLLEMVETFDRPNEMNWSSFKNSMNNFKLHNILWIGLTCSYMVVDWRNISRKETIKNHPFFYFVANLLALALFSFEADADPFRVYRSDSRESPKNK